MYHIVTGVTANVGVPSTYLVAENFDHFDSSRDYDLTMNVC